MRQTITCRRPAQRPAEPTSPSGAEHEQVIRRGDIHENPPRLAAHHLRLELKIVGYRAQAVVEGAPEPVPGGYA